MKHIKHHPLINDGKQKLSKDMKKQELIKPKRDKKLDADDSLSDIKVSKRYTKPSNKKLSGEKHLASGKGKVKKVGKRQVEKKATDKKIAYVTVKKGTINVFPKA